MCLRESSRSIAKRGCKLVGSIVPRRSSSTSPVARSLRDSRPKTSISSAKPPLATPFPKRTASLDSSSFLHSVDKEHAIRAVAFACRSRKKATRAPTLSVCEIGKERKNTSFLPGEAAKYCASRFWRTYSVRRERSSGLTLLEVLASLAILSGILSGLIIARGRLLEQYRHATDKQVALEVADSLLEELFRDLETIPRSSLEEHRAAGKTYRWRIESATGRLEGLRGELLSFELFQEEGPLEDPIVKLDLVLPGGPPARGATR